MPPVSVQMRILVLFSDDKGWRQDERNYISLEQREAKMLIPLKPEGSTYAYCFTGSYHGWISLRGKVYNPPLHQNHLPKSVLVVQLTLYGYCINQVTEIKSKHNNLVWGEVRMVVNLNYVSNLVYIISLWTILRGKWINIWGWKATVHEEIMGFFRLSLSLEKPSWT